MLDYNSAMLDIDRVVLETLNSFAQKSWTFDSILSFLTQSNLLKGGVVMTIFWWIWFHPGPRQHNRSIILKTFAGCCLAAFITLFLTSAFCFRTRPIADPELHFVKPFGNFVFDLTKRSSFPSDHATLFFALCTGLWFISRRIGLWMTIYTVLFISFPRLYCGLHYFSDVTAGAAIGALCVCLVQFTKTGENIGNFLLKQVDERPALSYALLFLFTYQVGSIFFDARVLAKFIVMLTDAWLHHV